MLAEHISFVYACQKDFGEILNTPSSENTGNNIDSNHKRKGINNLNLLYKAQINKNITERSEFERKYERIRKYLKILNLEKNTQQDKSPVKRFFPPLKLPKLSIFSYKST